jgi:hypothetical protein
LSRIRVLQSVMTATKQTRLYRDAEGKR